MSVEKKIYSGWAFKENEDEKRKMNSEIYKELKAKYKILVRNGNLEEIEQYDFVARSKPGYHHTEYTILKKPEGMTKDEAALICDGGNLCFGYKQYLYGPYVFED